jgi:hypothetical protein
VIEPAATASELLTVDNPDVLSSLTDETLKPIIR